MKEGEFKMKTKKINKRIIRETSIYNYLIGMVKQDKELPTLKDLYERLEFDGHISTLCKALQSLDKQKKIIYSQGKVRAVNIPNVMSRTEHTMVAAKQEPKQEIRTINNVKMTDDEQKYDRAVKELVADYITNADINSKDELISYIDILYKITDKFKEKLLRKGA